MNVTGLEVKFMLYKFMEIHVILHAKACTHLKNHENIRSVNDYNFYVRKIGI